MSSRIQDLGRKFQHLPTILEEYELALEGVDKYLTIKGKTLKDANREAQHQFYYDEKRVELSTLVDHMEDHVGKVRSDIFRRLTEKSPRELSDRAKEKYIEGEEDFLFAKGLYREVKEVYEKYKAVTEAFKNRGYALNNITRAITANAEEHVL